MIRSARARRAPKGSVFGILLRPLPPKRSGLRIVASYDIESFDVPVEHTVWADGRTIHRALGPISAASWAYDRFGPDFAKHCLIQPVIGGRRPADFGDQMASC